MFTQYFKFSWSWVYKMPLKGAVTIGLSNGRHALETVWPLEQKCDRIFRIGERNAPGGSVSLGRTDCCDGIGESGCQQT